MSRVAKLIVGATLIVSSAVLAQPAAPPKPPPPTAAPPPAAAPTAPPAQVDMSLPQRSSLGPQEMITQGRDYRAKMNDVVTRIQTLAQQAQRSKDIIRLNCVRDKLSQVKVNLNVADSSITALEEAIARKDEGAPVHSFTRVTIVNQKVQILGAEAEACVGEDLSFVGATRVDV